MNRFQQMDSRTAVGGSAGAAVCGVLGRDPDRRRLHVKPNADGVTAGSSETLSAGSDLYANETVRTGNLGQADLMFLDKTNLTVGPTSEVLLDKFVYDPTGAKSNVVFQATRGAFRFVTGTQDHRAYAVNTPYGSLGVRGTVVEVVTQPKGFCEAAKKKGQTPPGCECATKVRLVEGRASFRTNAGKVAQLTEPNQTVCISPTGAISYGESSTSILGFQIAGETPPPTTPTTPPTEGLEFLQLHQSHLASRNARHRALLFGSSQLTRGRCSVRVRSVERSSGLRARAVSASDVAGRGAVTTRARVCRHRSLGRQLIRMRSVNRTAVQAHPRQISVLSVCKTSVFFG